MKRSRCCALRFFNLVRETISSIESSTKPARRLCVGECDRTPADSLARGLADLESPTRAPSIGVDTATVSGLPRIYRGEGSAPTIAAWNKRSTRLSDRIVAAASRELVFQRVYA